MDFRMLDRRASEATGALLAGLRADQLDLPTPCTQWTVRGVVEHLVDTADFFTATARGAARPDRAGADPRPAFAAATADYLAAFADDAVLDLRFDLGGKGVVDGRAATAIHLVDVLVHGWDIGRATGVEVVLADDVVAAALRIAATYPDIPAVRGPGGAFAPALAVSDTASPVSRLVAMLGRDPEWAPAG
jgi:uncharacterized protein (TIGR03086 family)